MKNIRQVVRGLSISLAFILVSACGPQIESHAHNSCTTISELGLVACVDQAPSFGELVSQAAKKNDLPSAQSFCVHQWCVHNDLNGKWFCGVGSGDDVLKADLLRALENGQLSYLTE